MTLLKYIGGVSAMAFIECSYYSPILGITTNMNVCLPQDIANTQKGYSIPEGGFPTLYLLHGYGDDHTIWSRKCAIDRYATTHGIAVVMPFAGKSFYTDMYKGLPYYSYMTKELIDTCEMLFPLSKDPNSRFIGGLSMGGYGAFKIALSNPQLFKAAFSLSGVLESSRLSMLPPDDRLRQDLYAIWENLEEIEELPHNLFKLATKANLEAHKPSLFFCCGTEDFLYEGNKSFKKHLESINYDFTYHQGPGNHDFDYWESEVVFAMGWLKEHLGGYSNESNR